MTRFLALGEVLQVHELVIAQSGGSAGVRDMGALESAVAQSRLTFGGAELYPELHEKAATLCVSIVMNHPFIDGNKRTGHAAMETFLVLNGHEVASPIDEAEAIMLRLAAGECSREGFTAWIREHLKPRS